MGVGVGKQGAPAHLGLQLVCAVAFKQILKSTCSNTPPESVPCQRTQYQVDWAINREGLTMYNENHSRQGEWMAKHQKPATLQVGVERYAVGKHYGQKHLAETSKETQMTNSRQSSSSTTTVSDYNIPMNTGPTTWETVNTRKGRELGRTRSGGGGRSSSVVGQVSHPLTQTQ